MPRSFSSIVPSTLIQRRNAAYKPALARFSVFAFVFTGFLLYAGGFTTSIGAGMAFLDWPLSNGSLNPDGWLQNTAMTAEHSHRLLGTTVGLLTIALAIWLWRREARSWLRKLGFAALGLVVLQGVFGGLRVLLNDLHFAMAHACLAQTFLCVLVTIAAANSNGWITGEAAPLANASPSVRRWAIASVGLIFAQLMIAAVMRHSGAGLAMPWFPTSPTGALVPDMWDFRIGIHFSHRVMAVVITVALIGLTLKVWGDAASSLLMRRLSATLVGLLALQLFLGASIISSSRHPHITTWHVLVGAATLATTTLLAVLTCRHAIEACSALAEIERVPPAEVRTRVTIS